jgi:hypothetical protein
MKTMYEVSTHCSTADDSLGVPCACNVTFSQRMYTHAHGHLFTIWGGGVGLNPVLTKTMFYYITTVTPVENFAMSRSFGKP